MSLKVKGVEEGRVKVIGQKNLNAVVGFQQFAVVGLQQFSVVGLRDQQQQYFF